MGWCLAVVVSSRNHECSWDLNVLYYSAVLCVKWMSVEWSLCENVSESIYKHAVDVDGYVSVVGRGLLSRTEFRMVALHDALESSLSRFFNFLLLKPHREK